MTPTDLPAGETKTGAGVAPVAAAPRTAPVWLLIGATALGPMALNIFVPAMPRLVDAFETDVATIGLPLSLYLVALGAGQLVCGPIADRWGRRPTLLVGLALYAAAALVCAGASSIGMLITGRIVQAIGGCAAVVVVRAIIRDSYHRERGASVLAFVTMAMTIAPALSVTIGSYLVEHLDWRAGFVLLTLCALALLAAAIRCLPETQPVRNAGGGFVAAVAAYRTVLRSPVFCGFALCLAFTSAAFFAFVAGTASGLVGFAQMAIGGVATVAVALFADGSAAPMIAVMMGATILAALAYTLAVLGRRRLSAA